MSTTSISDQSIKSDTKQQTVIPSHPWYDDPLPYVICLAILYLVFLGLLTWSLGLNYKATQCIGHPSIWCSDNWVCNNNCGSGSRCFLNIGTTGLGSCLFGPNAVGATACNPPTDGSSGVACPCPSPLNNTKNCFSGCGGTLSGVTGMSGCCGCIDCSSGPAPKGKYCCPTTVTPCPAT